MRTFALALAMIAGMASVTRAAERPSRQVLSDMGLSGLTVLSDRQALEVRGSGFTTAAGWGFAVVSMKGGSAGSVNSYSAKGSHSSFGENYSEASVEVTKGGGHGGNSYGGGGGYGGGNTKSVTAFSGGSSRAGR